MSHWRQEHVPLEKRGRFLCGKRWAKLAIFSIISGGDLKHQVGSVILIASQS